jgi:hypothetical protein
MMYITGAYNREQPCWGTADGLSFLLFFALFFRLS